MSDAGWHLHRLLSETESLQSSQTDAHFATPNYHCITDKRKRWQYMFLKTYRHSRCQPFFSVVLMAIVHSTMKSSVTSSILRKENCIYSHWHVKQEVNLLDISSIKIYNKRKNCALLNACKKNFYFLQLFNSNWPQESTGRGKKKKVRTWLWRRQMIKSWLMPPKNTDQIT